MTLLWFILFLLHGGYTLVPVVQVQLGDSVTLTCVFTENFQVVTWVHWYKQTAGNKLKLISMRRKITENIYGPGFSASRFEIVNNGNESNLTIVSTVEEDEGMYHCAQIDWTDSTWTGTYLSLTGNSQRTLSYTVVQQSVVSVSSYPADSKTLQCSVLSESENLSCEEEPSVFWFRARSDSSYPDTIYTDGKRQENCEMRSGNQKKCRYNFTVNSSEADTYYCAVATCGEILFGNLLNQDENPRFKIIVSVITLVCLGLSVTLNIFFACCRAQKSACIPFKESSSSQLRHKDLTQPKEETENGQDMNYAALHFSGEKSPRRKKKRELKAEESVYSQVKGQLSI